MDLNWMRTGKKVSNKEMLKLVVQLSMPAIMAQLTSIVMQYIDAGMVGSMGANASASIGLVSSSTWLLNGLSVGTATGFSVQVAQYVGAGRDEEARNVFRQSLVVLTLLSLTISTIAALLSRNVPVWLGGDEAILADARSYFLIFTLFLPTVQIRQLCGAMLQCSGDMKTPGILNMTLCGLDVVFNALLIFPSGTISFLPGAGLGVTGAALGTGLSDLTVAVLMFYAVAFRSKSLKLKKGGSFRLKKETILTALKVAVPLSLDHSIMCSAYIISTGIVSSVGTVAIAAHSLAVTAESFCYMPGYGIGSAATTLVGQSIGADRKDLTRRFARTAVALGMIFMAVTGVLMFLLAPYAFSLLTPDLAVRELGTKVLRMELFAEPLYAASIVCAGAFRGAGDALVPSLMNLASMWGVRITLSLLMVKRMGLKGVWLAMAIELCFRGIIFLIRFFRENWLKKDLIKKNA